MIEVLKFTAPWCVPCKVMQPIIDTVRNEGYTIIDIDVADEANLEAADWYDIASVPTFVKLVDGVETNRRSGAMSRPELIGFINDINE